MFVAKTASALSWRRMSTITSAKTTDVKSWQDIPSLPRGLPYIGNFYYVTKKPYGVGQMAKQLGHLFQTYDPQGVGLLRGWSKAVNPKGDHNILFVANPDDFETMFRHEGKYPNRGAFFEPMLKWRHTRPDIFSNAIGVFFAEGPEWQETRSLIQQDMMRPKSAFFYLKNLEQISNEFLEKNEEYLDKDRVTLDGLQGRLFGFAAESIAIIAMDTRLGNFSAKQDPELKAMDQGLRAVIHALADIMMGPPIWKISPLLSPTYQTLTKNLNIFADVLKKRVDEARQRIQDKMNAGTNMMNEEVSVLEKLIIKCGPNSSVPLVNAFDMVTAGIDTTGNTAAFLLGNLAMHPDKQELLRKEILQFPTDLTESSMNKMKYLRAVLKESSRLNHLVLGHVRLMQEEITMNNYRIPANTFVFLSNQLASTNPKFFPEPLKFLPERWLRDSGSSHHPYSMIPFGHGPRMCVGKRFAELELQVLVCKVLQKYRLEWASPKPMEMEWNFVNQPKEQLKIRFRKLE